MNSPQCYNVQGVPKKEAHKARLALDEIAKQENCSIEVPGLLGLQEEQDRMAKDLN